MKSARSNTTVPWLLVLSLALFVIGFFAPLMTVKKFLFFVDRISLFSGLVDLFQERRYGLFGIILTFSVLLPLVKIGVLYGVCRRTAWTKPNVRTTLHWLTLIGKWAMLDVFIVALLVVVSSVRGFAEVEVHYGFYLFTASIIVLNLTAFHLDALVQRLTRHH